MVSGLFLPLPQCKGRKRSLVIKARRPLDLFSARRSKFNKLTSVFHASVLLLIMRIHSYFDNVMTKFIVNNKTDALKTGINLFLRYQIVKLSALVR